MSRSRPFRVLVNAVHSKSGGGVTYLRHLLPALAREPGIEVHLAVQADQREMARAIEGLGGLYVLPKLGQLSTVLWQEQVTVPLLAKGIGADVIFSPANYGPVWGMGRQTVILLRNSLDVTALDGRLHMRLHWLGVKALTWACFRTCRRAMVVSAFARDAFLRNFGLGGDERLAVVHHGVGSPFHPPPPDATRLPRRLLAVSDLYVQKNFETLIRAVAILAPGHPGLALDIAGRELDPGYAASLRALCAELGVADRVAFLGGVAAERVAELYRRRAVFIFPSLVETFGNPLVEAMASGIPVVCSDAAASPEVVGDAALKVAPRDPAAMADAIGMLLNDAALWRECSARGLRRAADFSWGTAAKAVARELRRAVAP